MASGNWAGSPVADVTRIPFHLGKLIRKIFVSEKFKNMVYSLDPKGQGQLALVEKYPEIVAQVAEYNGILGFMDKHMPDFKDKIKTPQGEFQGRYLLWEAFNGKKEAYEILKKFYENKGEEYQVHRNFLQEVSLLKMTYVNIDIKAHKNNPYYETVHVATLLAPEEAQMVVAMTDKSFKENPAVTSDKAMNADQQKIKDLVAAAQSSAENKNKIVASLLSAMDDKDVFKALEAFNLLKAVDHNYSDLFPVDLLLKEAIHYSNISFTAKNISVVTDFPQGHVFVKKSPMGRSRGDLNSVFWFELISNASKYSTKNGKVTIVLKQDNGQVLVSVKDTGIGIPASERENVWKEGYRAANAREFNAGQGLGLSMMKGVLENNYGGSITFESEEGKGTTFTLHIPNKAGTSDRAIIVKNGGIDLAHANTYLQTKNAGQGIKFHLDPAMLAQLQKASGFTPVIINIQPLNSLPAFLGLKDSEIPTV